MFHRLFRKKKPEPQPKDQWTIAQGDDNGLPLIFRVRNGTSLDGRRGLRKTRPSY